jgi:hypothetical protein
VRGWATRAVVGMRKSQLPMPEPSLFLKRTPACRGLPDWAGAAGFCDIPGRGKARKRQPSPAQQRLHRKTVGCATRLELALALPCHGRPTRPTSRQDDFMRGREERRWSPRSWEPATLGVAVHGIEVASLSLNRGLHTPFVCLAVNYRGCFLVRPCLGSAQVDDSLQPSRSTRLASINRKWVCCQPPGVVKLVYLRTSSCGCVAKCVGSSQPEGEMGTRSLARSWTAWTALSALKKHTAPPSEITQ